VPRNPKDFPTCFAPPGKFTPSRRDYFWHAPCIDKQKAISGALRASL
jgi:hypothetical protein